MPNPGRGAALRRHPVVRRDRPDGTVLLESAQPLEAYPASVTDHLRHWAAADAARLLVAERGPDGRWAKQTYGEALTAAPAIGQSFRSWILGAAAADDPFGQLHRPSPDNPRSAGADQCGVLLAQ